MHRFVGKPERPVDTLSARMEKIVSLWIYLGILLFLEGPIHVSMGHHLIVDYERPDHVEIVEINFPASKWETTTLH